MGFREREIVRLSGSGWAATPSIAAAAAASGLPDVTREALLTLFSDEEWDRAEDYCRQLRRHYASARFGSECEWGILLVPDPTLLDTRRPMSADARADQPTITRPDVFDGRLGPGALSVPSGRPWTMVATVTGPAGVSLGSYQDIRSLPGEACRVAGFDTRDAMTRQVWGARVLQRGAEPPDCENNQAWTFTIHAADELVAGMCESGTVLKGAVRYRLGKPDRGIGPARANPGIRVDPGRPGSG